MLAVIAAIISAFGMLLNWPRFSGGLLAIFASDLSDSAIIFGPGYDASEGKIVLAIALFMAVTFFLRPSSLLLKARSILLALAVAFLMLLTFYALKTHCPFYSYSGLIFSLILLFLAWFFSVMRIGAITPMPGNSQPITASRISMQLKSVFAGKIPGNQAKKLYVTALDDLNENWPKETTKAFTKREITFGRDKEWAEVPVGEIWGAVSNRHGKARIIGNSIFYEPIASHYAFALDNSPIRKAKEISQGTVLSLVSGLGPRVKLELKEGGQNGDIIPEVERKNEIKDDYSRLMRSTWRQLLILALLSLLLFGIFLVAQRHLSRKTFLPSGGSLSEEIRQGPAATRLGSG